MTKTQFRALWAVDMNHGYQEIEMKTAQALKTFVHGLDATVEPVTVFSPDQSRLPVPVFEQHWNSHLPEVRKVLHEWSGTAGFSAALEPKVLIQHAHSTGTSAALLLSYAREVGADLIAMGTSARTGLSRMVLGSFAESVALQSDIPLFIVNPVSQPLAEVKEILFTTDFSDSCRKAFNRVLPVAAAKGAKITLFHKLDYVVPDTAGMISSYAPYKAFMAQDTEHKRSMAEEWRQAAILEGVTVDLVLHDRPAYVVDSILEAAEKMQSNIVAMASRRGRAAALLGSVTRDLIRRSPDPVWVIHTG